jgi:hypothetical protein
MKDLRNKWVEETQTQVTSSYKSTTRNPQPFRKISYSKLQAEKALRYITPFPRNAVT